PHPGPCRNRDLPDRGDGDAPGMATGLRPGGGGPGLGPELCGLLRGLTPDPEQGALHLDLVGLRLLADPPALARRVEPRLPARGQRLRQPCGRGDAPGRAPLGVPGAGAVPLRQCGDGAEVARGPLPAPGPHPVRAPGVGDAPVSVPRTAPDLPGAHGPLAGRRRRGRPDAAGRRLAHARAGRVPAVPAGGRRVVATVHPDGSAQWVRLARGPASRPARLPRTPRGGAITPAIRAMSDLSCSRRVTRTRAHAGIL